MSVPISREASVKIGNLAFLLAVFVVVAHVRWVPEGAFGRVADSFFVRSVPRVAIPFFFAVSGFFLAAHFQEANWWRKAVRKRIGTLLAPYLFWLTVFAVLMLALSGRWVVGWGGYGLNPCRLPMVGPYWYIRSLLILVFVSPILKRVINRWGLKCIAVEYAAFLLLSVVTSAGLLEYESGLGGFLCFGFSLEGLFYFSLGLYLQEHRMAFRSNRWPAVFLSSGILLALLRAVLEEYHVPLPFHPNMLVSPLLLAGLWHFAPTSPWPRWIVACSFPVYLLHDIVLEILWQCGVPYDAVWQWPVFILGVIVPMALYHLMRLFLPKVSELAFGGR